MGMKPLDKVLINPLTAAELEEDCKALEAGIQAAMRGDPNARRVNIQDNQERLRRIRQQLDQEVAHEGDLSPREKDELAREERDLRARITHGMLDEETMRKCPSDAPNRHIQWENSHRADITRWKNIRQQLDPSNPEAQNLETYRPSGPTGRGYRADAAIEGAMSYGSVPQDKWDTAFSKPTPAPIVQPKKRGGTWTPAMRAAASERQKARLAVKGSH